ncbi:hypothetical protein [Candidatus Viadribacter manganicus]|uniref:Uncharacterized protein n=1 Tax=Candidatus Viadribacter manganicus TaxID=1759059 RepID=A0A1B1ALI6_9PROT|nr:hypothetical protein [Candidatus Viadribacter manganicus]ANP47414.1 hypothetical protein ATE48_16600 [Candidatus Viadribacter manganicus]
MAMLENNPILRERLLAFGAFAGIAVFAVACVDTMVTGGFDFAPGRVEQWRRQPSAYVRVVDAAQYVTDPFREVSWDEPMFVGDAAASTTEDLAGANDGTPPSDVSTEASSENLYEEIASLYESEPETAYEDPEPEAAYVDEAYQGDIAQGAGDDKAASAYGNGSPW